MTRRKTVAEMLADPVPTNSQPMEGHGIFQALCNMMCYFPLSAFKCMKALCMRFWWAHRETQRAAAWPETYKSKVIHDQKESICCWDDTQANIFVWYSTWTGQLGIAVFPSWLSVVKLSFPRGKGESQGSCWAGKSHREMVVCSFLPLPSAFFL